MSRQDRRPLSQAPEDSVYSNMRPLASPATQHDSFTLHPYKTFDTFAYYPPDASPHPTDPNGAPYHPADVQDVGNIGTEFPILPSMQFLPQTPIPLPSAQPPLPFADPSQETEALSHSPDRSPPTWDLDLNAIFNFTSYSPDHPPSAWDLDPILNSTDLFAGLLPDTESSEISLPQTPPTAIAPHLSALDMTQEYSEASPPAASPVQPNTEGSRRYRARIHPTPGTSGFVPSDPDDISPHEKKRLYVECLEEYIQYLHQLFASIQVHPVPLERVSSYRGLTTRSMRTILLTLNTSAHKVHEINVDEANRSMDLRAALAQVQAANYAWQTYESGVASPSSDSAGTSSTCVASDPEVEFSKYLAKSSLGGFDAEEPSEIHL